jgi:hypothetical protein
VIQQTNGVAGVVLGRGQSRRPGASRVSASVVLDHLETVERWFGHQQSKRVGNVRAMNEQHGLA